MIVFRRLLTLVLIIPLVAAQEGQPCTSSGPLLMCQNAVSYQCWAGQWKVAQKCGPVGCNTNPQQEGFCAPDFSDFPSGPPSGSPPPVSNPSPAPQPQNGGNNGAANGGTPPANNPPVNGPAPVGNGNANGNTGNTAPATNNNGTPQPAASNRPLPSNPVSLPGGNQQQQQPTPSGSPSPSQNSNPNPNQNSNAGTGTDKNISPNPTDSPSQNGSGNKLPSPDQNLDGDKSKDGNKNNNGLIFGVVGGIAAVVVVSAVVGFLVRRRRAERKNNWANINGGNGNVPSLLPVAGAGPNLYGQPYNNGNGNVPPLSMNNTPSLYGQAYNEAGITPLTLTPPSALSMTSIPPPRHPSPEPSRGSSSNTAVTVHEDAGPVNLDLPPSYENLLPTPDTPNSSTASTSQPQLPLKRSPNGPHYTTDDEALKAAITATNGPHHPTDDEALKAAITASLANMDPEDLRAAITASLFDTGRAPNPALYNIHLRAAQMAGDVGSNEKNGHR